MNLEGNLAMRAANEIDLEVTETDPKDRALLVHSPRTFSTRLHADMNVHGLQLPQGSEIFYTERGRLTSIWLGDMTRIGANTFPGTSIAYFFPDAQLDWVSLASDTRLKTNCAQVKKLIAHRLVSFYRNGILKETTLAEAMQIAGYRFPAGTVVHFSNQGQLVWVHINEPMEIRFNKQVLIAAANSCLEFHHNGSLRSIVLANKTEILGHKFHAGVTVCLDMDGKLSLAKVMRLLTHSRRRSHSQTAVRFHRDGMIKEITIG